MISNLTSGFVSDWKGLSPQVAVVRALRASRILGMGEVRRRLFANKAFQRHIATVAKDDAVFFLSHRHYLAKGLTVHQRAQTALHHYEREVEAYDERYFDAVYRGHGLLLWRCETDDGVFDIRLMPGNDVLYEGGLSIVAFFKGVRIAVLSYSAVPTDVMLPAYAAAEGEAPVGDSILFITRKQLTADHSYQKAFNKAFDRSTPGHFCFGALAGLAMAQGHRHVIGISPAVQPSCSPDIEHHFRVAYTEFWESIAGRPVSPYGYLVQVPMVLTPLESLDAKARKRALARRKHIDAVRDSAYKAIRQHLLAPPPETLASRVAADAFAAMPIAAGGGSEQGATYVDRAGSLAVR